MPRRRHPGTGGQVALSAALPTVPRFRSTLESNIQFQIYSMDAQKAKTLQDFLVPEISQHELNGEGLAFGIPFRHRISTVLWMV